MADEQSVRQKWDEFVAEAKAAEHLSVAPGVSLGAPVRISQIAPEPGKEKAPSKLSPKKDDPKQAAKPPMFGGDKKSSASE